MQELPLDHFTERRIPKKGAAGDRVKFRTIFIPDDEAMLWHRLTLESMYGDRLVDNSWAIGGMPGMSLIDNVLPHAENLSFYTLDAVNAFGNVSIDRLRGVLETAAQEGRATDDYSGFLDDFGWTYRTPGLPQGAPCSPYLFNLYCQDMDYELGAFCANHDMTYTRWLDDFTFSSPNADGAFGKAERRAIREIIESYGLPINHRKSHLHQRVDMPVTITGLSIYPDGRIQPSPELIEKMRQEFDDVRDRLGQNPSDEELLYLRSILNGWNGVIELGEYQQRGVNMPSAMRKAKGTYHSLSRIALGLSAGE